MRRSTRNDPSRKPHFTGRFRKVSQGLARHIYPPSLVLLPTLPPASVERDILSSPKAVQTGYYRLVQKAERYRAITLVLFFALCIGSIAFALFREGSSPPVKFIALGNPQASIAFVHERRNELSPYQVSNGATLSPLQQQIQQLQGRHLLLFSGSPRIPEVALTFDDGPSLYTPGILAVLTQYHVQATFFCVGLEVASYPGIILQEVRDGDAVENHTYDHSDLTTLSPSGIQSELNHTSQLIQGAGAPAPTLLRPPYGAMSISMLNTSIDSHYSVALWSVDAQDWAVPGVNKIVQNIFDPTSDGSYLGNGAIILMHDGGGDRSETVQALPRIIQNLQADGYRFVTVPQLIQDEQGS